MAVFVDTNVLVYWKDSTETEKQPRAGEWLTYLWTIRAGRLSVQVLEEFYSVTTTKLRPSLQAEEIRADIRAFRTWTPVPVDVELLESAWKMGDRFGISFWDAMIVAAANAAGCEHLLTEDLQHDREFDGLRVIDPFVVDPGSI